MSKNWFHANFLHINWIHQFLCMFAKQGRKRMKMCVKWVNIHILPVAFDSMEDLCWWIDRHMWFLAKWRVGLCSFVHKVRWIAVGIVLPSRNPYEISLKLKFKMGNCKIIEKSMKKIKIVKLEFSNFYSFLASWLHDSRSSFQQSGVRLLIR